MRGCLVALPCIAGALLAPTPRITTTPRQSQAAPERFERADDAQRLAKRIETVLARRTSRLIVVLERLVDGHNYSAIFRTCEALGVQHVWVVAPPPGGARFESRSSLRRKAKAERARQYAANDANRRADDQPARHTMPTRRQRARAAYKPLARTFHPDRWQTSAHAADATKVFQAIQKAYEHYSSASAATPATR